MDEELLASLSGKSRDEILWENTSGYLASLPGDLEDAVYRAAVVHWFNADILDALRSAGALKTLARGLPLRTSSGADLYAALQGLHFVEEYPGRGHNLHSLTREILLRHLWRDERSFFVDVSERAADYYSPYAGDNQDRPLSPETVEYVYHLLVADEEIGIDLLEELQQQAIQRGQLGVAHALVEAAEEHANGGRLSAKLLPVVQVLRAGVAVETGDLELAKELAAHAKDADESDPSLREKAVEILAAVEYRTANLQEAYKLYQETLARIRELGFPEREREAIALVGLGDIAKDRGEYRSALGFLFEALEVAVKDLLDDSDGAEAGVDYTLHASDPRDWKQADQSFYVRVEPLRPPSDPGGETDEPQFRQIDADGLLAAVCQRLASLHFVLDGYAAAAGWSDLAIRMYEALDDEEGVAIAAIVLRDVGATTGDHEIQQRVVEYQRTVLLRARRQGNERAELYALLNLASAYQAAFDHPAARDHYEQAAAFAQSLQIRDRFGEALALEGLAELEWAAGHYAAAEARFAACLDILRTTDRSEEARLLTRVAQLHLARHRPESAAEHLQTALSLFTELAMPGGQLDAYMGLGRVANDRQQFDEAIEHYGRAAKLARETGRQSLEADALSFVGQARRDRREYALARPALTRALEVMRSIGNRLGEGRVLLDLGDVERDEGALEIALELYGQAGKIFEETGDREGEFNTLFGKFSVQRKKGEREAAVATAEEILRRARAMERSHELRALWAVSEAYGDAGRHDLAVSRAKERVELDPEDAGALGSLGWELYRDDQYEQSIEASLRAFTMDSTLAWVLTNVGLSLLAIGRPDEAETYFRKRIKLRQQGESFKEDAIKDLHDFMGRHPDDQRAQQLLALFEAAQAELDVSAQAE